MDGSHVGGHSASEGDSTMNNENHQNHSIHNHMSSAVSQQKLWPDCSIASAGSISSQETLNNNVHGLPGSSGQIGHHHPNSPDQERQMNAFMLWSCPQPEKIVKYNLKMSNREMCKQLVADRKPLAEIDERPFIDVAKCLTALHTKGLFFGGINPLPLPKSHQTQEAAAVATNQSQNLHEAQKAPLLPPTSLNCFYTGLLSGISAPFLYASAVAAGLYNSSSTSSPGSSPGTSTPNDIEAHNDKCTQQTSTSALLKKLLRRQN